MQKRQQKQQDLILPIIKHFPLGYIYYKWGNSLEQNDKIMGGFTGICATIPGRDSNFSQGTIGASMFITYTPTNSYVVDSSAPSQQFKFVSYRLPDGSTCYYRYHAPWAVKYQTNLPTIGGYNSSTINVGTWINILLNAYYR